MEFDLELVTEIENCDLDMLIYDLDAIMMKKYGGVQWRNFE
jgi:hypothetical protein